MRAFTIAAILVFALLDVSGCKNVGTERSDKRGTGGDLARSSDTESSKQYLHVAVYRKAPPGKALRFTISERRSKGIPRFEAEKAWAISVAKSLTLL